jgi:hypothetical protein
MRNELPHRSPAAAELGDARAQTRLGEIYTHGIGVAPNRDMAIDWLRRAARQGSVVAEAQLGTLLMEGKTPPPEGVAWLRKAAEAGDAPSQYNLSRAYRLGLGVPADTEQLVFWLRKAAEQGEPAGLDGYGYAILTGLDDTYDYVAACTWLILAVERSQPGDAHNRAVVNLGNAKAELTPSEIAAAERNAALWRGVFLARNNVAGLHRAAH